MSQVRGSNPCFSLTKAAYYHCTNSAFPVLLDPITRLYFGPFTPDPLRFLLFLFEGLYSPASCVRAERNQLRQEFTLLAVRRPAAAFSQL